MIRPLAGASLLALSAMAAFTPAAHADDRDQAPAAVVDISFKGGSVGMFLEQVVVLMHANVVAPPDVRALQIENVVLWNVDQLTALSILDGRVFESKEGPVVLNVRRQDGAEAGSAPVFILHAEPVDRQRSAPLISRTWTVAHLIEGGMTHETIASALETGLSLFENTAAPAIRVHRESNLLLMRGAAEQVALVNEILHGLREGLATSSSQRKKMDDANAALERAEDRERELEATRERLEGTLRGVAMSEERVRLLSAEIEIQRDQRLKIEEESRQMRLALTQRIEDLTMKIEALERRLEEKAGGGGA